MEILYLRIYYIEWIYRIEFVIVLKTINIYKIKDISVKEIVRVAMYRRWLVLPIGLVSAGLAAKAIQYNNGLKKLHLKSSLALVALSQMKSKVHMQA